MPKHIKKLKNNNKIKNPIGVKKISPNPIFCFKNIDDSLVTSNIDKKHHLKILKKILFFSKLDWDKISALPKETGTEKISINKSNKFTMPIGFQEENFILAFRTSGKARILGARKGEIFHILFFDENHDLI